MKTTFVRATVVLVQAAIALTAVGLAAQISNPIRDPALVTGTSAIRGRTVDAQSGHPLRHVIVSLYAASGDRVGRSALTDADGRYEIDKLPAGRYRLIARSEAYLDIEYGQTRPAQNGRPVVLQKDQRLDDINFSLPLGGAIEGTVRDEFGDPLPNVQVRAMRPMYREGRRLLETQPGLYGITGTNDLGEYRLFGLVPGPVYLITSTLLAPVASVPGAAVENSGAGMIPSYYPGTSNFGEAQRLTLKLGETLSNMNFTLKMVRTASVRVLPVDGADRPVAAPLFRLSQIGPGILYSFGPSPGGDGTFAVPNLSPGDYDLRITGTSAEDRTPLVDNRRLTLKEGDALDLRAVATPMANVSGRLVVNAATGASPPVGNLTFQVDAAALLDASPYQAKAPSSVSVRTMPDRSLTFSFQPGRAIVLPSTLPVGWFFKGVRLNGADVSDGVELTAGPMSGLEMEITDRASEISGTVRNENNEPVADYAIVIFARDPARRQGWTRYFATARPDMTGTIKLLALPPAEYLAIALDYADPETIFDPASLEALVGRATAITLGDAEAKRLDLVLQR